MKNKNNEKFLENLLGVVLVIGIAFFIALPWTIIITATIIILIMTKIIRDSKKEADNNINNKTLNDNNISDIAYTENKRERKVIENESDNNLYSDKELDSYSLDDWQKDLVNSGENNPWDFEEEDYESDDYYYEDDDNYHYDDSDEDE